MSGPGAILSLTMIMIRWPDHPPHAARALRRRRERGAGDTKPHTPHGMARDATTQQLHQPPWITLFGLILSPLLWFFSCSSADHVMLADRFGCRQPGAAKRLHSRVNDGHRECLTKCFGGSAHGDYVNRLTEARAGSATSRQPLSMVSPCPRFLISMNSQSRLRCLVVVVCNPPKECPITRPASCGGHG